MRVLPQVIEYRTRVRVASPFSIWISSALGSLTNKDIDGSRGTIRYGEPGVQTQRSKYGGYLAPEQMFIGYDPSKVAAGAVRIGRGQLPATNAPDGTWTPLQSAMLAVAGGQGARTMGS